MDPGNSLGKYVLLDRIAIGGMAEVFRAAIHGAQGFAKEVIIKRILPDLAEDATFVRMFIDEARLASQLEHPNVIRILDFDCIEGVHFIAMEYVRGRDLGYLLKKAAEKHEKLPESVALFVFAQLLEALRYAHEKQIVHRDVSPQNILLSFEGEVKLADFGIAKAAGSSRTATGSLKGKYRYMAPEYILEHRVDHQSDLYAAGAVLYQLITGSHPFDGVHDMALLKEIAAGSYRRPREVDPTISPALASMIETAMATRPEDRFPSARVFLETLKETCRARNVELGPEPLRRFLREHLPKERDAPHMGDVATAANKTLANDGAATRLLAGEPASSARKAWVAALLLAALVFAGIAHFFGAPPAKVTVLVRMMTEQEDWLRTNALAPFTEEQDLELAIKRYNSVQDVEAALREDASISLVKVELAMLRPLVESELLLPIDTYLKDRDRTEELDRLLASFQPLAIEMAMVPDDVTLHLYGLPRKLETSVLVYRESRVLDAVARWSQHLQELEERLIDKTGHGLPSGHALEADPSKWDLYDVLVAGWYWSRTEPRVMNRSYDYLHTFYSLYEQLSAISSEPTPQLSATTAMIDLFEWEALYRELGIYRDEMFVREAVINGRAVQDAMAKGEIYLTRMHPLGVKLIYDGASDEVKSDLRVALLPLGVSMQLDSEGMPARIGSRRSPVSAWFWAIPKNAPHPEEAYRLARHLTGKEVAEREAEMFLIQPASRELRPVHGPFADLILPVAEVQTKIAGTHRVPAVPSKGDVDRMSAELVGAWWKIVAGRRYLDGGRIDRQTIARALESAL